MKVALAQLDPVVGAFDLNVQKIASAYERACASQARLLLTSELSVSGYPPHDLMDRPEMFERTAAAVKTLLALTKGKKTALAIGHVAINPEPFGRAARNCVSILEDGEIVFTQAKTLLPTYDVFDEARYFEPSKETALWDAGGGEKVAVAICEDLWGGDSVLGRHLYGRNPVQDYERLKPSLIVSLSASPYEFGKRLRREKLHADIARKLGVPMIYVNQFGATDEILFDGASFVLDPAGKNVARFQAFGSAFGVVDTALLAASQPGAVDANADDREDDPPTELDVLIRGLITGIQDYFARTGFKLAALGLSGGIDSAVVATLAVHALGPKNVLGLAMPSQYSSAHSLADAEQLARNLEIPFESRPIKFLFSASQKEIGDARGGLNAIAQENLQARLRGLVLMTLSNHYNALVLTTGNKSEIAVGYCTLYGDMCGALAPLGDVLKTRVYEIARRLNELFGSPIPESTLTKAPSAELKPDQKDQDSLPPYDQLDAMLVDYLENHLPVAELETKHGKWVPEILRKIEMNEYKRRQGAPVLKVSPKAFGIGRRVPIAKVWDQKV